MCLPSWNGDAELLFVSCAVFPNAATMLLLEWSFENIHLIFHWIPIAVRVQFTFFSWVKRTLMLEHSPAPSHSIPYPWHLKPQTTCSSSNMSCSHLLSFYHCGMPSILSFYFNNNFCLSHFSSNLSKFRMPSWPKSLFQFHIAYNAYFNHNICHIYHTLCIALFLFLSYKNTKPRGQVLSQADNRYLINVY